MRLVTFFRLAISAAILSVLLAYPSPVSACSCVADVTIPDNYSQHDAVFTGRIMRVVDNYTPIFSTMDYVMYTLGSPNSFFYHFVRNNEKMLGFSVFLKVINSWKGVETTYIKINTGRGNGDCGYTFEMDKEYLIYASHAYGIPDNYWVTSTCSRNAELKDATADLDYLSTFPNLTLKSTLPVMWTEKDLIYSSPFILGCVVFFAMRFRKRKK